MPVAARDDQRVLALQLRAQLGHPDAASISSSKSRLMYSTVFAMNALIWSASPALAVVMADRDRVGGLHGALGEHCLADVERVAVEPDRLAVADLCRTRQGRRRRRAGCRPRAATAGPRFGYRPLMLGAALTTAATSRLQQRLRADPVEVGVVDDGDVAGPQPLGQVLGAPVQPRGRHQAGQVRRPVPRPASEACASRRLIVLPSVPDRLRSDGIGGFTPSGSPPR